jgi:predicted PurR-regulated permease PerM
MDKKIYLSIMAAIATTGVVWLFALFAAPFAKPLAWALIIGIATIPHHDRLVRHFPGRPNRSAGLMVLIIALCIILPVAALIFLIAQNAAVWYRESEQLVLAFTHSAPQTLSSFPLGSKLMNFADKLGIDFAGYAAKFATSAAQYLITAASNTAKNLAGLAFTLAVALFILFFVYRDGKRIVSAAISRFATDTTKAQYYLSEIRSTTTAVTVGTILTCVVQGALAGLGYFVAGVPAAVLCGVLTAVAALIPVVGTALIWVPLVILVAISGAFVKAGLLALWCVVFVGLADNVIRPLAIGAKGNVPTLAIVLGAVGGAMAIGLIGLILGPLFFALLAVIWRDLTEQQNSIESGF